MISRGLYELAVDINLIDHIDQGPEKLMAYCEVEKLRVARKIVDFVTNYPDSALGVNAAVHIDFIAQKGADIDDLENRIWPSANRGRRTPGQLKHWSGLNLSQRAAQLKQPFDRIYQVIYPQLSWYAHAGLTGTPNLRSEGYEVLSGYASTVASCSYELARECPEDRRK